MYREMPMEMGGCILRLDHVLYTRHLLKMKFLVYAGYMMYRCSAHHMDTRLLLGMDSLSNLELMGI